MRYPGKDDLIVFTGSQNIKMTKQLALAGMICIFCSFPFHISADNVTLCYHKFSSSMEDIYSVLPDVFEWQIEYIKGRDIPIIHLSDLVNAYATGTWSIGNNVLLTADDGWKSVLNIIPIVEKEKVPVTLYLYPVVIHNGSEHYLDPEELEQVKKEPWFEFGCHSYTHPLLTKLAEGMLKHEVVDSKARLEKWLGIKLDTFAYPFGGVNWRVKRYCRKYYKIIMGVNNGSNNLHTDKFNLNRCIIYKNTTFGEFMDIIDTAYGKDRPAPYKLIKIGASDEYGRGIIYPKVKYYKYEVPDKTGTVLFLPGSEIGPGWMYKAIRKLMNCGVQCGALVMRNNNIPFYRPDSKTMQVIQDWGLKKYTDDIKSALDYIFRQEKKTVIVTWGDGFDQIMSILSSTGKYNGYIKGIVVLNPSFSDGTGKDFFRKTVNDCDELLAKGEYASGDLNFFLKIKTISDMEVLKPDESSIFTRKMGYSGSMTNKELLEKTLNDADHPDLGIDYNHGEYTLEDFNQAFKQPLPLFSMVVPVALRRDLSSLWLNDFTAGYLGIKGTGDVTLPVSFIYSDYYEDSVKYIKGVFPCIQNGNDFAMGGISTIEMMLSNNVAVFITGELLKMLKSDLK
jgi:peptidoglycan/xylan/chitin deacetylase (PgdA/CDA1 family)